MADSEWVKALGSIPGTVSDTVSGWFGGGTPTPQDAGIPGAGTASAPDVGAAATGVDTTALAGLGGSFSAGAGERGLPGSGGLSSVISQFSNGGAAAAGSAPSGAAPVSMPLSVSPGAGGGMFVGNVDAEPSSVTGKTSYNTGGWFGGSATGAPGVDPRGESTAGQGGSSPHAATAAFELWASWACRCVVAIRPEGR